MPGVVMSLVTTEPAPITTSSAMRTGMIVALEPIETRLPITVARHSSLSPARRAAGREGVVDEHHAMADEAVLADRHQFADEGMRLHAGARADRDALLDLGERPDEAVVADPAAVEIARLDDLDAARRTRRRARRPDASRGSVHDATPSRHSSRREAQRHFLAGLDRFVERGDQFQALAPLEAVDQRRALVDQAIDHVLVIGLVAEAVDVRRIDGKFLDHVLVRRQARRQNASAGSG